MEHFTLLGFFRLLIALLTLERNKARSPPDYSRLANHHQFPSSAGLFYRETLICSAVLIDERWAMTARHCLDNDLVGEDGDQYLELSVGGYSVLYEQEVDRSFHKVKRYYVNDDKEKFDIKGKSAQGDIVLLMLQTSIVPKPGRREVARMPTNAPPRNEVCETSCWGTIDERGHEYFPVQVKFQLNWPHFSFFCAQRLRGAIVRTGCSGGPLYCQTSDGFVVQGIVSRSSRDNPTYFYANVYNLYSEIKKVMNDHEPKKVKDEDPHGELKKK